MFGGGDDSEGELIFTPASNPPIAIGGWASLDVPLANFVGLTGRTATAQLIIAGSANTVYVDNIYWHN